MKDFFDLPEDSFVEKKKKSVDENIYDPSPANTKENVYKSVIRFIPNIKDKANSKYKKTSARFYNPLTKSSVYVDCPTNEGKPSILLDLEILKNRLKNSEPEVYKKIDERFSRWSVYYSYVYIKKDISRPELDNSIKIFKFRHHVNSLIDQLINPEIDELVSVKKGNPYHLLKGRDFLCIVGMKTKTFRDWSKCKFMEEDTPFVFKLEDGTEYVMDESEESINKFVQFFESKAPKMEEYYHKEWTDETYEMVADEIISAVGYPTLLKQLIDGTRDEKMAKLLRQKLTNKSSVSVEPEVVNSSDVFNDSTEPTTTTTEPNSDANSDDNNSTLDGSEYDSILNGL